MGLLFWGLANEITNLSDAATLYPLFGLGANLAQALAGLVLKVGLGLCSVLVTVLVTMQCVAATLYPLLGLASNLAQALAGLVLKVRFMFEGGCSTL
jgi:hypothetical protein